MTPPPPNAPRVTLVRTLCGVESHSVETLRSGFELDYPDFELLLCVALPSDPIIPVARRMIEAYPRVQARLLIGDERISANPKLNNMLKGWRAADGEWVVFADSNIILPRDYLQRALSAWGPGVGLVSAPPIGDDPQNFWSEIECGLLNTHQARWQYVVDALGFGFGQGKTLMFRRDELAAIGFHKLADEPAEDAAATKAIRAAGKVVRLACPPFRQPLGLRTAEAVWSRHLRWARLRRMTFGALFAPEIFAGIVPALVIVAVASTYAQAPVAVTLPAFAVLWFLPEALLARVAGWPCSMRSLAAWIVRDITLPALWAAAWTGRGVTWRGNVVTRDPGPARSAN